MILTHIYRQWYDTWYMYHSPWLNLIIYQPGLPRNCLILTSSRGESFTCSITSSSFTQVYILYNYVLFMFIYIYILCILVFQIKNGLLSKSWSWKNSLMLILLLVQNSGRKTLLFLFGCIKMTILMADSLPYKLNCCNCCNCWPWDSQTLTLLLLSNKTTPAVGRRPPEKWFRMTIAICDICLLDGSFKNLPCTDTYSPTKCVI